MTVVQWNRIWRCILNNDKHASPGATDKFDSTLSSKTRYKAKDLHSHYESPRQGTTRLLVTALNFF